MSRVIRGLLVQGNRKLGTAIHHWDLPPVVSCPGRTPACERVCYARSGHFTTKVVKTRLKWCMEQSRRDDFVSRMVNELHRKGVLVCRVHCSGDFYSATYAGKWLAIMKECPQVKFYLYSRSYRCEDIAPVLKQMATLKNVRVWYSTDSDTGTPAVIPPNVRLAHLNTSDGEEAEALDLLFVTRPLKQEAIRKALPMLCPQQSGKQENCGSCGKCFR